MRSHFASQVAPRTSRQVNAWLHEGASDSPAELSLMAFALEAFRKVGSVLGLLELSPSGYLQSVQQEAVQSSGVDPAEIDGLIAERAQARKDKNWGHADEIRDLLAEKNIVIEDSPEGTTWKVKTD